MFGSKTTMWKYSGPNCVTDAKLYTEDCNCTPRVSGHPRGNSTAPSSPSNVETVHKIN